MALGGNKRGSVRGGSPRRAAAQPAQSAAVNKPVQGRSTVAQPTFWDRISGTHTVGQRSPVGDGAVGRQSSGGPSNRVVPTSEGLTTGDEYAATLTPGASVLGQPVGTQKASVFDWTPASRPGGGIGPASASPADGDWYSMIQNWKPGQGGSLGAGDQIVGTFQDLVQGWSETDIYDFMDGLGVSPLRPNALGELVDQIVADNGLEDLSPEEQAAAVSKFLKLEARDYGPVQSVGSSLTPGALSGALSYSALDSMLNAGWTPPSGETAGSAMPDLGANFNQMLEDMFNVPSMFY